MLKFGSGSKKFKLEFTRSEKLNLPEDMPWKHQLIHSIVKNIASKGWCILPLVVYCVLEILRILFD